MLERFPFGASSQRIGRPFITRMMKGRPSIVPETRAVGSAAVSSTVVSLSSKEVRPFSSPPSTVQR